MACRRSFTPICLTLIAWLLAASASRAQTQTALNCESRRLQLAVEADGDYLLQLDANQNYVGWLMENGADVAVSTDDGVSWVDSAPWRWTSEPLRLTTADDGSARMVIRGLRKPGHVFDLDLRCEADVDERALRFWSSARTVSMLRTQLDQDWSVWEGLRALCLAMRARYFEVSDDLQRSWIEMQLAALARQRGLLREAADFYRLSAEHARDAGLRKWYSSALFRRAQALSVAGERDVGEMLLEAERVSREEGQLYQAVSARQDYCVHLRTRGDAGAAVDCLKAQVVAFRDLGEHDDECVAMRNLVVALLFQGRYGEARSTLASASKLADSLDDPKESAGVLLLQSHLNTWEGRFGEALQQLEQVRDIREQHAGPLQAARIDSLIANIYLQSGQPDLARAYLEQAIHGFRRWGAKGWLGDALVSLSHAQALQQRFDLAIASAEAAVATTADDGSLTQHADAVIQLAALQANQGRMEAARVTLAKLQVERTQLPWKRQVDVALIERMADRRQGASKADESLLALLDGSFERGQMVQFLDLAALLARLENGTLDEAGIEARLDRAMDVGHVAAMRIASPLLRNALLTRLRPLALRSMFRLDADEILGTNDVERLLAPMESLRRIARVTPRMRVDDDDLTELERVLSDQLLGRRVPGISAERRRLLLESISRSEARVDTTPPALVSLQLSALANPDTDIFYFAADDGRFGFLHWNGSSWRWQRIADGDAWQRDLKEIETMLQSGQASREQLAQVAGRLSRQLGLGDSFDQRRSRTHRVYVVADPAVWSLPWMMLPVGSGGTLLADVAEIVLLQSLEFRLSPPIATVRLLGAPQDGSTSLATLPRLQEELDALRRIWPQRSSQQIVAATQADLSAALALPDALVHVAAHGRGDHGRFEESGLWLMSADDGAPAFVSALRLQSSNAHAPLVVLSACESGMSGFPALGAAGVAGSLVDAGAGAVVGSRWVVSDRTASQFSLAFHSALSRPGTSVSAALGQAIASMRARPSTSHPRHWSGWFLLQSGPDGVQGTDSVGAIDPQLATLPQ